LISRSVGYTTLVTFGSNILDIINWFFEANIICLLSTSISIDWIGFKILLNDQECVLILFDISHVIGEYIRNVCDWFSIINKVFSFALYANAWTIRFERRTIAFKVELDWLKIINDII
jgi:hypothetical protein